MAAKGSVSINTDECKGCGLCVESCPPKTLHLAEGLNQYGVHPAEYKGDGCTGCGICFYVCPEPGAITVYKAATSPSPKMGEGPATRNQEVDYATVV
jgi:NAD-dependent dihydropyrimidine dehydrogenase PreA subunit